MLAQPSVEFGLPAREVVEAMSLAQRLREVRLVRYRRTEPRAVAAARASARSTRGGSSSAAISRSK